ncbi:putative acetylcholinesterase [Apostichopus japonicus]|uniref:Carboxylic ester hydrolase n=1 Tax=Stichopus japonicus TaxID=307972 RepID=A0A2G8L0S6_STIJA|nr:putative acetylcholinesterase [Apostichopus japonicus]
MSPIALAFLILVSSVTTLICAEQEQPTVTLKDGTELVGIYDEFHSDELPAHAKLETYYGIPYAEPPVGDLRFKPPVAKGKLESPFSASEIGKSCIQIDPQVTGLPLTNEEMSEDCLFLDVIVPHPRPEKAAVFFWIHGGGFTIGAGNMPLGGTIPLVSYGNLIAVSINYRLNAFGFMTTVDDLIPGNLGLRDQQLALKWVQENIEAFGGDPERVTIGGVSAGSSSASLQMLSPDSSGLFKNVIMQSGSSLDVWNTFRSPEDGRREVKAMAKLLECSPEDIEDDPKLLQCLLAAPAEAILEMSSKVGEELGNPSFPSPGPSLDGVFLPQDPLSLIEAGKINGENVIVGTNAEEGTLFLYMISQDKEVRPKVNSTTFGVALSLLFNDNIDPALHDLIKLIYAPDPSILLDESRDDFFKEVTQYLGDRTFLCSESKFGRKVSPFLDVYRYTMTYVPSKNFMDIKWAGAAHGDEILYVSGGVFEGKFYNESTEEEKVLSRKALSYWVNFIQTGNPNTPEDAEPNSLPIWPKFTKEDELFKDLTPAMNNIYMKRRECYFIEHVLPPLKKAFEELKELRLKRDEQSKWSEEGQCEGESCHQDQPPVENEP